MGQAQSLSTPIEPPNPKDPKITLTPQQREELERKRAEDRQTRLLATEQRLAKARALKVGDGKKKLSALEEASRENKGYRDLDGQRVWVAYD